MAEGRRFPRACVASAHHLASSVGLSVLADGGNAMDAAVATNLTMGVVAPYLCGYGGDVFALVWHEREAHGYLGSGRAPMAATREAVTAAVGAAMPFRGPFTVTVPGAVRGWFDLLERFGTRSFAELARPAYRYARDGFELSTAGGLAFQFLGGHQGREWHEVYGEAAPGRLLRQPGLAKTIEVLSEDGPEPYYSGPIATAIAEAVQGEGALLAVDDLRAHHGEWCQPLSAPYRALEVLELPPPTQGVTALQMLRMLDRLGPLPGDAVERTHRMVEVVKQAMVDRDAFVTDPDHMPVDPADLLTDEWIRERCERIDPARAVQPGPAERRPGGTTYICAADADGLLVSLIQTNFEDFGSGVTVPEWGINLQNRGAMFSLDARHVNVVAPGKRSLHTLIPALALRDREPAFVFGTMSGDTQPMVHLQLLARLVDDAADVQEALDAPRWRVMPGDWRVLAEPGVGGKVVEGLRSRGHVVETTGELDVKMGHAHAIAVTPHGYAAGADPRSEGLALGF